MSNPDWKPTTQLRVACLMDDRLTRERMHQLVRTLGIVKQTTQFQLWADLTEAQLLKKVETEKPNLLLLPWHKYLPWSKVDPFFGSNRVGGTLVSGYFAEPVKWEELGTEPGRGRMALLDLAHPTPQEAVQIVTMMADEARRGGLQSWIETGAAYSDLWWAGSPLGTKIDTVLALPQLAQGEWPKRVPAIRLIMNALWSVIFDEGPGKISDLNRRAPKAGFQVGINGYTLAMRLGFMMPSWGTNASTLKEGLKDLWPDAQQPGRPWQLLHQHADFIRVHSVHETGEIELVVALLASAPSRQSPNRMRTLWADPISVKHIAREPLIPKIGDAPAAAANAGAPGAGAAQAAGGGNPAVQANAILAAVTAERAKFKTFLSDTANKMRDLKKAVVDREEVIRELRSGGVGTAPPLPPADGAALLEAFQQRYFEAQFQMRQIQIQIDRAEKEGATPLQIEQMRKKILALSEQEKGWISQIQQTLITYKKRRES